MNNNEKHDQFEEKLAQAMRRVDAPKSLAVYLMNAAEAEQPRVTSTTRSPGGMFAFPKRQSWFGGVVAAMLVAGTFGAVYERHQHERALEAVQQFEASQRITNQALEHVREQLQRKGISLDTQ